MTLEHLSVEKMRYVIISLTCSDFDEQIVYISC